MKILKPLLILGGICIALVVLAELVVRLLFPVPMEPPGGLTLTNDIAGVKSSVNFQFDGDRLRKVSWGEKKSTDGVRILCVGGNGTTALLQSAPDSWWGVLAKQLSIVSGKTVGAASPASLEGGKILPAVAAVEKILEKYEVDLVVAIFGFSDAIATPGDYKLEPGKLDRLRKSEPVGFKYQLAKASHLLRLIRNAKTSRAHRSHQSELSRPNYYRDWLMARARFHASRPMAEDLIRTGDDPIEEYLEGIDALAAVAKKNGAKLLVVGEPTIYKSSLAPAEASRLTVLWHPMQPVEGLAESSGFRVRPLAVETELQRYYNVAQEKCASLGVKWANLQGEVPRYGDYFVTETYLTDQGSQTVAEKLLPAVAEVLGIAGTAPVESGE